MKTDLSIKQTYHDALFFASSKKLNSKQLYYLEPSEYKVLIKLIHYSSTHEDITFQNKDIALHVFLAERTVKNSIEVLARKGYIQSESDKFNNRLGWKSKRTISINWDFIQSISDKIGEIIEIKKETTPIVEELKVKEESKLIEDNNKEVKEWWFINKHDCKSITRKTIIDEVDFNTISIKKLQDLMYKYDNELTI